MGLKLVALVMLPQHMVNMGMLILSRPEEEKVVGNVTSGFATRHVIGTLEPVLKVRLKLVGLA